MGNKKGGCGTVLVVLISIVVLGQIVDKDSTPKTKNTIEKTTVAVTTATPQITAPPTTVAPVTTTIVMDESASATDNQAFISKYETNIVAAASMALDRFISGYKMSLAPQKWTIAKFDETDTVMAMTDITYNGKSGKYYYVGTLDIQNEKVSGAKPHFVYVIDTVLGNDGYCDDFFSKISKIGQ